MKLAATHGQAILAGTARLWRRPLSSALTLAGIGVALAVPLTLYVLVVNLSGVFDVREVSPRLSLYVDPAAEPARTADLAAALRNDPAISRVEIIGRAHALDELLAEGGLTALRDSLGENPLPDVIEVFPRGAPDRAAYALLAGRLAALDGVTDVQVDLQWISRLRSVTSLALVVVRVFWVLLFAGVAMAIANSVRLSLVTARDEIEVVSLVGGSEAFIRRPYLYVGLIYGVIGALVAVLIALAVHTLVAPALASMLEAYLGVSHVRFASTGFLARVVVVSGLIGWVTSWVTVSRYLREVSPR